MSKLTRKTVTNAIKEKHGVEIEIFHDESEGYYFFYSDDNRIADHLTFLTTSVLVYRLNHLSLEQWVESFEGMFTGQDDVTIEDLK